MSFRESILKQERQTGVRQLALRRRFNKLAGGRRVRPMRTSDTNVGVEIEICCRSEDEDDIPYNWDELLNYFDKQDDGSIVCDEGEAIEFVLRWDTARCEGCDSPDEVMRDTHGNLLCPHCWDRLESRGLWSDKDIVRPQKWFREKKNILEDVKTIQEGCTECGDNGHGKNSCGLHVHVSHPEVTKEAYPDFGIWVMEHWALEQQEKMMKKWNLRSDNTYCKRNQGCFYTEKTEKYLQMNIFNSDAGSLWHVEFRGHDGFAPSAKNALRRFEKYVDDVATLFVNMFRKYRQGKPASKKPHNEELIRLMVNGVDSETDEEVASKEDRIRWVQNGLKNGRIPKDFKEYTGKNLLMIAYEDPDMVQVLLEHGVDPNTITFYHHGYTKGGQEIPLSLLLWTIGVNTGAFDEKNVRIRALLKQRGAVLDDTLLTMLFDTEEYFGYEFNADSVRAALEYGISPNDASTGDSLLNMCVHNTENPNYLDMTKVLLDAGADPNRDPGCWDTEEEVLDLFSNRGFTPSEDVFWSEDIEVEELKRRFPTAYANAHEDDY